MQRFDGLFGLRRRTHIDKAKPTRLSGILIRNHPRRFDSAVCRKQIGQLFFCDRVRQTTDVQFLTHVLWLHVDGGGWITLRDDHERSRTWEHILHTMICSLCLRGMMHLVMA